MPSTNVRAGTLRHLLTFQTNSGSLTHPTWSDSFTMWGSIEPSPSAYSGPEGFFEKDRVIIKTRHNSSITDRLRITHGSDTYDIESIADVNERGAMIEITAWKRPASNVSITYKILTSTSYDVEAGTQTRTETELSIGAIRGSVTTEEVDRSGGTLQVGDRRYVIEKEDMTTTPTVNDLIVDGSDTLMVVFWQEHSLKSYYTVMARKV